MYTEAYSLSNYPRKTMFSIYGFINITFRINYLS